ncbi:nickel pincer cofactor biosynthesis protein LarC [Coleofasciculus sp. FACHB-SPT36]|uniref:nickel pincer cofactor biosynthesis protein LarC n=1 Tax=Cyanophyceae TaxID=3028117 RepID=UPI00168BAC85|nr:nickel pincer cofactor biosynthesis protein LarC [Coleofasciculus sp. FACHB-SPT36]MBD2541748.1 nickel pincer cofactor biosynthesis protein LarC [Coleofasciculus sp. FACHB-SPT36]
MNKLAYLECPTGIAGDMCLGALVDAGVPLDYLIEKLKRLGISQEYQLRAEHVHRNGQQATKFHVDLSDRDRTDSNHHHEHHRQNGGHQHQHYDGDRDRVHSHSPTRHLPEIVQLIAAAEFPLRVQASSLAVFQRLADAEGAVHGIPPEEVHFHEVGATDAIVDIVGTCLGLDWLGIDELYCSALPTGGGMVRAAHGQLAVPVPAVLKLWESRQVPVYSNGIDRELVTPTGAAIACTLATGFGSPPPMTIQRVGNGAGSRQLPIPNILRLWIGEGVETRFASQQESGFLQPSESPSLEIISVLETQIDDLSPQAIGYVFEALFNAGAVDVFTQPIGMKKSRPGILLTVICHPEQISACEAILFRETTTLGIRRQTQQRSILQREIQQVLTEYGFVRVKVAWTGHPNQKAIANVQPEYEDCAELAKANNLPWREVHQLALNTWYLQNSRNT